MCHPGLNSSLCPSCSKDWHEMMKRASGKDSQPLPSASQSLSWRFLLWRSSRQGSFLGTTKYQILDLELRLGPHCYQARKDEARLDYLLFFF